MLTFEKTQKNRIAIVLFLTVSMLLTSACDLTGEDKDNIEDAFNPTLPAPGDDTISAKCELETFRQPEAEVVKKIDILFVTDTSGSLNAERKDVALGINAFVSELPADVNYNVGVLYAHATDKKGAGILRGSPKVLSSEDMDIGEITTELYNRMNNPVGEGKTDGGEVGMYALHRALTDKLTDNKAEGFFRDDAALAVVFVADENDICSWESYPDGVTPVWDPNNKELPAFDLYCDGISPESIVTDIQNVKGDKPFLVSGIVYNGDNPFPATGENEIGYGYLETIEMANGITVDLASGDYEVGMRDMGYLAYLKLNLLTEFNLSRDDFVQDTLEVFVDQSSVDFVYAEELNQVQIAHEDAGGSESEVAIRYCLPLGPPPVISNMRIFRITFTTADLEYETDQPTTERVILTNLDTGDVMVLPDDNPAMYHERRLSGLTTNTNYEVEVIAENADGQFDSETANFKTLNDADLLL